MNMRIVRSNVTYCTICDDVSDMRKAWEEEQKLAIRDGDDEQEIKPFPGVPGYVIKDTDEYKFTHTSVCECCINTLIKGIKVIHENELIGVSLTSR